MKGGNKKEGKNEKKYFFETPFTSVPDHRRNTYECFADKNK